MYNYAIVITEKRNKEIQETMLKARDAKYSIPIRYGKVLFCGAANAGKSNFLNLLMKEEFQPLHISTEVLKPQQVTIAAIKAVILSNDDDEVEFNKMQIDDEILQLESYLPKIYNTPVAPLQKIALQEPSQNGPSEDNLPKKHTISTVPLQKSFLQKPLQYREDEASADNSEIDVDVANVKMKLGDNNKFAIANLKTDKTKLNKKLPGAVWDILTFMDTGGQPQFISMLPAVNSFAMITFIVHKMETGGQSSLNEIVKVQYGNEKGEVSYKPHPHKYTYLQLIETLISYASNILPPDTKFLNKVTIECKNHDNTRSVLLTGTHSGDDQLSEDNINDTDVELAKVVKKSGVNHIRPQLNKNYQFLVPVDNKLQGKNSELQVTEKDTKRYTDPAVIRRYIRNFLDYQDKIHVPIKWLLLELEIRKVCQQRNCSLMSYYDVLQLSEERQLGYNGEFGIDADIDSEQFIKQGLRFHHSFGVLLYFEDVEGMQKLVITNHQWLFNKLSKIVEYSFNCETLEEMEDLKIGIFKRTLLDSGCLDIKKDFKESRIDNESVNPINAFLKLLEYLRIAAPSNKNAMKYFMPCILKSCDLSDLTEKVPQYKANNIESLLIQFASTDNKIFSFPRGAFCFLVVELMVSMKWEPCDQAYVNLIRLFKKDTAHYITLIDRIFCLEVHVTYRKDNNVHDEVRKIINEALHTVGRKLKIDSNLCHGFTCNTCQDLEKIHISYLSEDVDSHCWCNKKSVTYLTDSHRLWLSTYFKVRKL